MPSLQRLEEPAVEARKERQEARCGEGPVEHQSVGDQWYPQSSHQRPVRGTGKVDRMAGFLVPGFGMLVRGSRDDGDGAARRVLGVLSVPQLVPSVDCWDLVEVVRGRGGGNGPLECSGIPRVGLRLLASSKAADR